MLQSGYSFGFLLSSIVFQFVYPIVNRGGTGVGWRVMLWIGVLPAFMLLFMMRSVKESPVWLERQRHLAREQRTDSLSIVGLFSRDVIAATIHTSLLMGAFLFMYHSITFWYPTLITRMHRPTLPFLFALNLGGVTGALAVGRWSEGAMGRRGAATLATFVGLLSIPLYVWTTNGVYLWIGALLMGFFGAGNFGVVPAYLNERFPTSVRAAGAGFAYHFGAGIGSLTPTLVGRLQDIGFSLPLAMSICIIASGTLVMILIWLGPETRGRQFHAHH
jgi:SHS family lactate transporter-like MFS transporter